LETHRHDWKVAPDWEWGPNTKTEECFPCRSLRVAPLETVEPNRPGIRIQGRRFILEVTLPPGHTSTELTPDDRRLLERVAGKSTSVTPSSGSTASGSSEARKPTP
jgi:hypothetical protein